MRSVSRVSLLDQFTCLGDACEDTCCQNWSMQVDDATLEKYKNEAPQLLAYVETESDGLTVMKRDATTRRCVKLDGGWCGIHKEKGDAFLGDACHFYPRVTREIGPLTHMTATPSCPEIVRLLLRLEEPFALAQTSVERIPHGIKNYSLEGLEPSHALAIHQAMLQTAHDATLTAEQAFSYIASVARSMELLDPANWHQAVPLYLRLASGRLPAPQPKAEDPFNLLHALCGLIVASHKPISPRLQEIISDMERIVAVKLDWENVTLHTSPASLQAYHAVLDQWQQQAPNYNHALKRYLQAQLSLSLFPFAGLGHSFSERITIIGVRFATVKLALMCAAAMKPLSEDDIVRIIQSLSRFLDHLGDANFSLSIYEETGWNNEARMLSLLGV